MLVVYSALCALLAAPAPQEPAARAVRRLDPGARVGLAHGHLRSVRLSDAAATPPPAGVSLADHAAGYLRRLGPAFGLRDPASDLRLDRAERDRLGFQRLVYEQRVGEVPVFGAGLRVHADAASRVRTVEGLVVPDIAVDTTPRIGAEVAAAHARALLRGEGAAGDLETTVHGLYAFRTGLARGLDGTDHLAWRIEVRGAGMRAFAFVDAHSGKVVEVQSARPAELSLRVHQGSLAGPVLWSQPDPVPDPVDLTGTDVPAIVAATAATYDFFRTLSGGTRLSYDGTDATMLAVAALSSTQDCDSPNAYWDGYSADFCAGAASDDSVAHEWVHAYTEYTDGLTYMWQSGALDEAYSDIFGETVDLLAPGESPEGLRADGRCSTLAAPPPPLLTVADSPLAGTYQAGPALFGPPPADAFPLSGTLVLADDATADPTDACEPLVGTTVAGNVALVRRGGDCTFVTKVQHAQDAGAVAVVVYDNQGSGLLTMGGYSVSITIPSIFIDQGLGEGLAAVAPVAVTLAVSPMPTDADASTRWLLAEDAVAFGGALRDLWSPDCLGGPGKVSDTAYACGSGDNGGVHVNSTVPSHAYALLVDGGTYNGVTVGPVGLDKAAQIYWRAKQYQGPYTGFPEHATALEASCQDLVDSGTPVPSLSGATPSEVVSDADCQQVAAAAQAVELTREPDQCGFEPELAPGDPPQCEPVSILLREDFETDTGWERQNHGVYMAFTPRNWTRSGDLPGGRPGAAYYAPATDIGDCNPQRDDQAGLLYLTSPEITVPTGEDHVVLEFTQYFATEPEVDGGVVRVSVDGGSFVRVGPEAFGFNGYNAMLMTPQAGNDNPLAGEPAFSGTDGGRLHGSWARSQASLSGYVHGGQKLRVQFVLGVDGCGGIDGWYVDDVQLVTCGRALEERGGCAALPAPLSAVGALLALAVAALRRRRL